MDRKAMWISAVATLLGAMLLWLYIRRFEHEATGGAKTRVLMLTRDAKQGAVVQRELLAERALPEAYLESRHISARDADQVLGAKLGVDARAGEALLWTDLASLRDRGRQLSSLIPEGKRAIALELRTGGLERLLAAGDRVDVLLATRRSDAVSTDANARVVAQNLLVLAVGDDLGGPRQPRAMSNARSVSLAVTPEQAARLTDAEQNGSLRLTLRNSEDLDITNAHAPTATTAAGALSANAEAR